MAHRHHRRHHHNARHRRGISTGAWVGIGAVALLLLRGGSLSGLLGTPQPSVAGFGAWTPPVMPRPIHITPPPIPAQFTPWNLSPRALSAESAWWNNLWHQVQPWQHWLNQWAAGIPTGYWS